MRPERSDGINSLLTRSVQVVAAILLALIVFRAGAARAADSAPQTSASPTYDTETFIKELAKLKAGLESARKSTETQRSYRESLPKAWVVDAGDRHYDVPT